MSQGQSWIRYPLDEINYLFTFIFSYLSSGVLAKRGVEFLRSTRNASRIRRKVSNESDLRGTECLNTRLPNSMYLPCYVRDIA